MSISDYYENKILDHMVRAQAFTPPSTVYVALFTVSPIDSGGGTEVSGGSYTRQAATFNAASNGFITNSADITFPQATADWGTIVSVGLFDASTAGNLLWYGDLTASQTVNNGNILKISAGSLNVSID
jgi:hypothetical protein